MIYCFIYNHLPIDLIPYTSLRYYSSAIVHCLMSVNGIVPHILMMPTQKGSGAGDYQQKQNTGSRSVHIPTSPEQVHALLQLQTCLFFCFAINILTALGAVQHVLCDCYADKIFCEFSPHQCFSFGLSQLGSLPSKMDCFDQSI